MWLFALAIIAFVVGNQLRRAGIEATRANTCRSPAALAGRRKSGIGTWINIAGGVCLLAAVLWACA